MKDQSLRTSTVMLAATIFRSTVSVPGKWWWLSQVDPQDYRYRVLICGHPDINRIEQGRDMSDIAQRTSQKMTSAENFWWIVMCICSLGGAYFAKVLLKKAMLEVADAQQVHAEYLHQQATPRPNFQTGPPAPQSPPA